MKIEWKIKAWLVGIGLAAGGSCGLYIYNFAWSPGKGFSDDPAVWGQFGDYLGGTLSWLVAAAAFYWLTQSVRIQHQEMRETRKALQDAAQAQRKTSESQAQQVELAALAAQLNAASVVVNAANSEIGHLQARLQFFVNHSGTGAMAVDINGEIVGQAEMQRRQSLLNVQVRDAMAERDQSKRLIVALSQEVFRVRGISVASNNDAPAAKPHQT